MRKLSGPEWFAKYRQTGESQFKAIERLQRATDLNLKTIYRAVVYGARVSPETIDTLEKVAGEGRFDRIAMLTAPTEKVAKQMMRARGEYVRKRRADFGVPRAAGGAR